MDRDADRADEQEMKFAVLLLVPSIAFADLRHEDVQVTRTELTGMTAVRSVPKGTGWVEEAREIRVYDQQGHISRHEHRKPDGSLFVSYDYQWDPQGRVASYTYKDNTKRSERRDFTYQVDAKGRVVEKIMRDPSKPVGEYYRYEYIYEADGSHRIQSYRHYPKESYRSSYEQVDAKGRTTTSCREHGGCDLNEYDANGVLTRVRQQSKETHHYLTFDTTYSGSGQIATRIVGNIVSSYAWNARGDVSEIVERVIPAQGGAVRSKTVYTYKYR